MPPLSAACPASSTIISSACAQARLSAQAFPIGDWKGTKQALPLLREEGSDATAEQPIELGAAAGRNAEQDELADPARVLLGVDERQHAAPRAAEYEPPLDSEVFA